jgi:hypothetical protein
MKKTQLLPALSGAVTLSVFIILSCSKGGSMAPPPDPCSGVTITVTGTTADADAGASNGSITATAAGGSGFSYSLNNGTFQSSGTFTNLAAGTYTLTAKTAAGCTGSTTITVNAKDACAGKTITVTPTLTQGADPCTGGGKVTVTAAGSTGFTYNADNGSFQASGDFSNLSAGSHSFGAKDNGGCVKTATITVSTVAAGTKFSDVKAIIQANCAVSGCHNGTQSPNFTVDCNIAANSSLIKTRAVDDANTANQMPKPPRAALSQADRDKITAWVTAGGRYTD